MGVLFFALNLVFGIAIPLAIQVWDRDRLSDEERAWVWGYASWGSALYNFGPLSLVAWGYVTRSPRYLRGLAVGVGWTGVALVAQGVFGEVFGRLLRVPERQLEQARSGVVGAFVVACILAVIIGTGRAIYEAARGGAGRA